MILKGKKISHSQICILTLIQGKEIEKHNQKEIIHAPSLYWIILLDEDINIDRLMPLSSNIDINQVNSSIPISPFTKALYRPMSSFRLQRSGVRER